MRKMIEARKAMGYSQDELSRICGCSRATIANIELGKGSPSLDLADRIALVLNTNVYELFFMRTWDDYIVRINDARHEGYVACFNRLTTSVFELDD